MTIADCGHQLEQLQAWRRRPQRAHAIVDGIDSFDRRARQLQRRLGRFVEAWEASLPPRLHQRTCVQGVRGGVANVTVDSSAISFEIDRRLREGLLQDLRGTCGATLVRVRLRVGPLTGSLTDG